jgi:predicted acetyltransferase
MTVPARRTASYLEVIPASARDQLVMANLIELYIHEFTDFLPIQIGEDGRFGYPNLPLYWSEPTRHPFLVRLDGNLAGLVLVKQGSEITSDPHVWDMAEFFVLRAFRRSGIGTQIALKVWRDFPGRWEVRVMQKNVAACKFWRHSVSVFASETPSSSHFQKNGEPWEIFSFESPGRKSLNLAAAGR